MPDQKPVPACAAIVDLLPDDAAKAVVMSPLNLPLIIHQAAMLTSITSRD